MATFGWLSAEMRYTVLDEIGLGRMTRVHKAVEDDTGKVLAVRFYNRLPLVSEEATRRMFLRVEAETLEMARGGVRRAITGRYPEMLLSWLTLRSASYSRLRADALSGLSTYDGADAYGLLHAQTVRLDGPNRAKARTHQ
jgi:hypothetical protein